MQMQTMLPFHSNIHQISDTLSTLLALGFNNAKYLFSIKLKRCLLKLLQNNLKISESALPKNPVPISTKTSLSCNLWIFSGEWKVMRTQMEEDERRDFSALKLEHLD